MKITKLSTSSNVTSTTSITSDISQSYVKAQAKIKEAIDILGVHASADANAREAVANLAVVLLDMKQS